MSRYLLIIISLLTIASTRASGLRFEGCRYVPVPETVSPETGLDALYVLYDVDNVSISFDIPAAASQIVWKKFGYMGAAYAEPVEPANIETSGNVTTIKNIEGDTGYAIDYGSDTYYFWIADYSRHPYHVSGIYPSAEQDCSTTSLTVDGEASRITYYSINARAYNLDRDITLSYRTLERNEDNVTFSQADKEVKLQWLQSTIHAPAPLCDTPFTLEGDKYLRAWGMEESTTTSTVAAHAIDIITSVRQEARDNENEIKTETTLGGSAPVTVTFTGAVSDAAVYREWQMSRDIDFYDITYRNTDLDFTYTFTEMGTIYVRLLAANASGDCELQCDPYSVYIGESSLKCPNAFSPGSTIGVNDEWRVSYKSIISFECYIFDRWGTKMTEFHDPALGWDGKYKGKYVPAGVYYYVIKAKGSDGTDYNLSGDINILKSNR